MTGARLRGSVSQAEAVTLAIAAYTLFVFADTTIKGLGFARLPPYEVVGLVAAGELLLLLCVWAVRRNLRSLWPRRPGPLLARASLDLLNNLCVVIALRHLPLALFYILVFLAPSVTSLLAAVWLHEHLDWRRSMAIAVGFAGVLTVVQPLGLSRSGDWIGIGACMLCVSCFSLSIVWSRVMTQTETPESLVFLSALLQAVVGLAAMLWHAVPLTLPVSGLLAAVAVFSVAGSISFFLAVKHTSAANVAQFHYTQLLTGSLLAFLIWRERPTMSMWAGAALIIASGVYTARRARGPTAHAAALPAEADTSASS